MSKTLFLINPFSAKIRRKGVDKVIHYIEDTYRKQRAVVEVRKIDFDQLDTWLANAHQEGFVNIFAVGGDGTANSLGAKLVHTPLNMGIIPMGSGNGFARNIGFSIDFELAIRQSVRPQVIKVDTGTFGKHFFLNVGSVGFDADVATDYNTSKMRGMLAYANSTFKIFNAYQAQSYEVIIDENTYQFEGVWSVGVVNGTQWGYDFKMSPENLLSDGILEVLIIKKIPIMGLPAFMRNIFFGNIDRTKYVERLHGRHVLIKRKQAGAAQVDGEPITEEATIEATIYPQSLNLLLPNTVTLNKIRSL